MLKNEYPYAVVVSYTFDDDVGGVSLPVGG